MNAELFTDAKLKRELAYLVHLNNCYSPCPLRMAAYEQLTAALKARQG